MAHRHSGSPLLAEVRSAIRVWHYSLRTEDACLGWAGRDPAAIGIEAWTILNSGPRAPSGTMARQDAQLVAGRQGLAEQGAGAGDKTRGCVTEFRDNYLESRRTPVYRHRYSRFANGDKQPFTAVNLPAGSVPRHL